MTNDQIFEELIQLDRERLEGSPRITRGGLDRLKQYRDHLLGLLDLGLQDQAEDKLLLEMCRAWGREISGEISEGAGVGACLNGVRGLRHPDDTTYLQEARDRLRLAAARELGRKIAYLTPEDEKDVPAIVFREVMAGRMQCGGETTALPARWIDYKQTTKGMGRLGVYYLRGGGALGFIVEITPALQESFAALGLDYLAESAQRALADSTPMFRTFFLDPSFEEDAEDPYSEDREDGEDLMEGDIRLWACSMEEAKENFRKALCLKDQIPEKEAMGAAEEAEAPAEKTA